MSVDYLPKYLTKEGFNFPGLLNDDFIQPIRLFYRHRHYVSSGKLLMIFIDSAGFLEFGDTSENTFMKWLDKYADLVKVGVTSEELWESRNSLLHMSNLDSRRVVAGKVARLMFYIGSLPDNFPTQSADAKYYSLLALIHAMAEACGRWAESFNKDREKFEQFLDRYDLIVSDSRMFWVNLEEKTSKP